MRPGGFILNNITSESQGVVIQDKPIIETPKRRIAFKQAFGQSGDNPFDEEAYDNTTMSLLMFATGSDAKTASDNRDRIYDLFDSGVYMDFIPYFDEKKIYRVMATEYPSFESKYYFGEGQSFNVELTVRPYKYYVQSPLVTLTTAGTINNTTSKTSLPRIKIFGSGDVTLKVNGINFVVKNVVDYIILDSNLMFAYKETGGLVSSENSKTFTRMYPFLKQGNNTISWTGTVSKVEIEPRWRTLA